MERNFYTDRFEHLLREKSDEFRMVPSKRVWHSIYNDLHPGRKWPSLTMGMILIIVLLMIGYLNSTDNSLSKMIVQTNTSNGNELALANPHSPISLSTDGSHQSDINSNFIPGTWPLSTGVYNFPAAQDNNDPFNEKRIDYSASVKLPDFNNDHHIIELVDNYIQSNQLFSDLESRSKKIQEQADKPVNTNISVEPADAVSDGLNRIARLDNTDNKIPFAGLNTARENKTIKPNEHLDQKPFSAQTKKSVSLEEKAWMEDFALHNKSGRQKWKDKMSVEIYATPVVGYRSLTNNIQNPVQANNISATASAGIENAVNHKPGIGLETGLGISYSLTRSIKLKAGVQLNYTSYGINADQTNHPILTNLLLNGPNNGMPYLAATTSTYSNSSGLQPVTLHNTTYQFSLPVGLAIKMAGNENLSWYTGASLQPGMVIGGTANLISSDYKNYITDASLIRRFNMNTSFETYINYKMGGYTLKVGPQIRYQLLSTYDSKYTFSEKLYNVGLKVGLVKSF